MIACKVQGTIFMVSKELKKVDAVLLPNPDSQCTNVNVFPLKIVSSNASIDNLMLNDGSLCMKVIIIISMRCSCPRLGVIVTVCLILQRDCSKLLKKVNNVCKNKKKRIK